MAKVKLNSLSCQGHSPRGSYVLELVANAQEVLSTDSSQLATCISVSVAGEGWVEVSMAG